MIYGDKVFDNPVEARAFGEFIATKIEGFVYKGLKVVSRNGQLVTPTWEY